MADPFLGEIRLMSFNFAPKTWALCDGQILPIDMNTALFSLVGTLYGGNGISTFALPNLQGRAPIHMSGAHALGEHAGEQAHTLSLAELPAHTHVLQGTANNAANAPANTTVLARSAPQPAYGAPVNLAAMDTSSIASTGGGQAHPNMQPFLTISFCIALMGVWPSPT